MQFGECIIIHTNLTFHKYDLNTEIPDTLYYKILGQKSQCKTPPNPHLHLPVYESRNYTLIITFCQSNYPIRGSQMFECSVRNLPI